jgi:LysR family transcriptional regulator, hydrogen peroxide-inducible genes activator
MTLQDLRYLVALAETRHFARAAEACHVSQPTLSTQIKKLEDELGVVLFERTNRRVAPTASGREIVTQARIVLEEIAKLQQLAQQGHDPMVGSLRLGTIPTLGPYLLPHLIPQLREAYPELRLYVREELTANLLGQLRTGSLDVLLLSLPIDSDGFEIVPLFREPFVLALPAEQPLTRKRQVREADLVHEHLLLLEDGHCLRDQALAVCGFPPQGEREVFRASSLETLRQMVASGVGCTLLPALAAATSSLSAPLIVFRPFAPPVPSRTIGLVWRRSFPRLATVQALAQLIRAQLPPGVHAITNPSAAVLPVTDSPDHTGSGR